MYTKTAMTSFERDTLNGLKKTPKKLSSKYFYDTEGDRLFQQIMAMPEYYLTDCELEIITHQGQAILDAISDKPFDLIELGAGDGMKTKVLLESAMQRNCEFRYIPLDISENILTELKNALAAQWPTMDVQPLVGDYFESLKHLPDAQGRTRVLLFLGANIGNLTPAEALQFLKQVRGHLRPGDALIVGFDLKKDPQIILNAYNDPAGITAAFNLNLLKRINREMEADFDLSLWRHWETYDPLTGATRSYLVSKKKQIIDLPTLKEHIHFKAWEAIQVELSQKYDEEMINKLAVRADFQTEASFYDNKGWFVDELWRAR